MYERMRSTIKIIQTKIKKIESDNYITSMDLKKAFGFKGEINSIQLSKGINQYQEENGESHNNDEWIIHTIQIIKDSENDILSPTKVGSFQKR